MHLAKSKSYEHCDNGRRLFSLFRQAMTFMLVVALCSCGLQRPIGQAPYPVPPEPTPPILEQPVVLIMTAEEAEWLSESCSLLQNGEVIDGLDKETACNWAIVGTTVQGSLAEEINLVRLTDYIERLRSWGRSMKRLIEGQSN